MTPHQQTVMVPGQLRGMGRSANCTVCAVRIALQGGGAYQYVRPIVTGAPGDLPNGTYVLTFDGRADLPTLRRRTVPRRADCSLCGDTPRIRHIEADTYVSPACAG